MLTSHLVPLLLALTSSPLTSARKITIKNSCAYTVWPGLFSKPGPLPDHPTGWRMDSGEEEILEVSDSWNSGRIWARTGCTEQDGVFTCLTGNCGNGTDGAGRDGDMGCVLTDIPPATLAEFTLAPTGADHYDISLVDGFNVPMNIIPSKQGCTAPKCEANINEVCPALLRTGIDATGVNLGCLHSCNAGFGMEQWGSRSCCNFGYNDPELCAICGVDYYNVFKDACPQAYAYAYDEKADALHTCETSAGDMSDYLVEFCPNSGSYIGVKDAPTKYANATATCSNMVSTYAPAQGETFTPLSVGPSPTTTISQGTLKIVATNMPNVGGQAAIATTPSSTSIPGQTASNAAPPSQITGDPASAPNSSASSQTDVAISPSETDMANSPSQPVASVPSESQAAPPVSQAAPSIPPASPSVNPPAEAPQPVAENQPAASPPQDDSVTPPAQTPSGQPAAAPEDNKSGSLITDTESVTMPQQAVAPSASNPAIPAPSTNNPGSPAQAQPAPSDPALSGNNAPGVGGGPGPDSGPL